MLILFILVDLLVKQNGAESVTDIVAGSTTIELFIVGNVLILY